MCASSAEKLSSRNSTRGRVTSARASATRWASPPESDRTFVRSSRCAISSVAETSATSPARPSSWPRTRRPNSMFARTDRCGNSATSCGMYATSRCSGSVAVTSRPSMRTAPPSTGRNPSSASSRTVLPVPDGPSKTSSSPLSMSSVIGWSRNGPEVATSERTAIMTRDASRALEERRGRRVRSRSTAGRGRAPCRSARSPGCCRSRPESSRSCFARSPRS